MGTGEGGVAVELGEGEKEEKGGGGGERRPHKEREGWSQSLDSEWGGGGPSTGPFVEWENPHPGGRGPRAERVLGILGRGGPGRAAEVVGVLAK